MSALKERLLDKFKLLDVFFGSLLFFVIAHGFMMVNLAYNHDSTMMITTDDVEQFELGRWLVPYYNRYARDGVVTYWFTMIISYFALFLICLIIAETLEFKLYQAICLCAVCTVNITLICLYSTYIPWADIQVISTALGCLAIWISNKSKKIYLHILSIVLLCMSMALYQAQINFAMGYVVLILLHECINKEMSFLDLIKRAAYFAGDIVAGGVLYLIGMIITKYRHNIIFRNSYNGPGSVMGHNENFIMKTWNGFFSGVRYFFDFFCKQLGYVSQWMKILGIVMIVASIVVLLYVFIFEIRNRVKTVEIIVLLLSFVVASNLMFAVTDGMIHTLMIFSYYLVYVLCIYICGFVNEFSFKTKKSTKIKVVLTTIVCGCILFTTYMNSMYANNIYLKKTLTYEQAARTLTTVWRDISEISGYVQGETPIVFVLRGGGDNSGGISYNNAGFSQYNLDNPFVGVDINSVFTDADTLWQSWAYMLGKGNIEVDKDIIEEDEYIASMPCFPANGYCELIDGQVIVKWSE